MTSSIVNYIVEKYLSNIVEIDLKRTNASILKGTIEMQNLRILPQIFESFNLPYLELVEGYVGSLKIKLKLPLFYSNPIKVYINKVFFHARQKNLAKRTYNDEVEAMEDSKNAKLQNAEEFSKQVLDLVKESSSMKEDIMSNLDIEIGEIVFLLDDIISCKEKPYSFGLIIKNFLIKSTNDAFDTHFDSSVLKQSERINKKLQLNSLRIFLDTHKSDENFDYGDLVDPSIAKAIDKNTKQFLNNNIKFYSYCLCEIAEKINHQYLVHNLDVDLNVAYNPNYLTNQKMCWLVDVTVKSLELSLDMKQVETINKVISYIKMESLYYIGIQESYYIKKLSKEQVKSYVENYMKYYQDKYYDNNSKFFPTKNLYEEEKGLSYEQIKSMRKAAIIQLTYTNQINDLNTQISKLEGKWFGGSNKNKDLDNLKRQKGELINKEKEIKKKVEIEFKKIPNSEYSIISEDKEIVSKETSSPVEVDDDELGPLYQKLPADFTKFLLFFTIDKFSISINENTNNLTIIDSVIETIHLEYEDRKVGNKLSFKLSSFSLNQYVKVNPLYPHLIFTKNFGNKKKNYLLTVNYEYNPSFPKSDYRLYIDNECRISVIMNPTAIFEIIEIFQKYGSTENNFKDIKKYAKGKMEQYIKAGYIEKLINNNTSINNHDRFNIDLNIRLLSPEIIIPFDINDETNSHCFYINLGEFSIKTELPNRKQSNIN